MQRTRKRQNERKLWRKQSDGIGRFLFCPHFLHLSLDLLRLLRWVYICPSASSRPLKTCSSSALWYTAIFTVVTVVLINVLAFAVALLLTKGFRGTNIFRTVFFMPNLIGGIILGYIWQLLLNGVLLYMNRTLTYSSVYGFWGLVILMCWQQIGYMMIIYIAGIQNIPGDLIEAAKIDGATSGQILKNVTIPMVMPSITICTFLTLTNSFKLFDQNLALTNGEPSNMSELLALNIFRTFYGRTGWEGVGQAKAVVFFLLVAAIALTQNWLTRRKEVQQ